ncbi:MAG: hypothetical protein SO003_04065, partial [Candidatus Borkfalkiaceae bacterium]|nr:hypothetical protein [Christensenellaceae bacterium]
YHDYKLNKRGFFERFCLKGAFYVGGDKIDGRRNAPSREIASRCSQRQFIMLVDSSVGYFACAQYDVLFIPYRRRCRHFHRRRKRVLFYCLCEEA